MSELEVLLQYLRDERKSLVDRVTGSVLEPTEYAKVVGRITQVDRVAERVIALAASDPDDEGPREPAPTPSKTRRPVINSKPRSWP